MMFKQEETSNYLKSLEMIMSTIPKERVDQIKVLSIKLKSILESKGICNVLFVCTHNSRRSQISELMFHLSCKHYDLKNYNSFSAGTEKTSFFPAAVEACRSKGITIIEKEGSLVNHSYCTVYPYTESAHVQYSKRFDDQSIPNDNLAAVMVCDHANENCPFIPGAEIRFGLSFTDPKYSDETNEQKTVYEQKVDEIGAQMMLLASFLSA